MKLSFDPNWPHLTPEGGQNRSRSQLFENFLSGIGNNFQKGPFTVNIAKIWWKQGFALLFGPYLTPI